MAVLQPGTTGTFSVGRSIGYGWRKSWKNFWRLLLISIVFLGLNLAINLVTGIANFNGIDLSQPADTLTPDQLFGAANLAISLVGAVVSFLLTIFLNLGMIRVALGVTEGQPALLGRVFSFNGFGRYLGGGIVVGIIIVVGILVGVVPGFLLTDATNSLVWIVLGIALGIVIAIALSVAFTFYGYAILNRDARGLSSLGASWDLVKPHFWAILGLSILIALISIGLFIAAIILGVLMIVIGLLITLPVASVIVFGLSNFSVAYAYKTISGEAVAP